jgi:acetyl esterase
MPVDPAIQPLLDALNDPEMPVATEMEPPAVREMFKGMMTLDGEEIPVAEVVDRAVPGPAGDIPVRVYTPDGEGPFPILVWYHGGGWVIGDLDTADSAARRLCTLAETLVVSVDYRLAPEHPFPAGTDDGWAALTWVAEHGADLGGDPTRLAIGGDSAGGTLAAEAALRAASEGGPAIALQLLVYPGCDLTMSYPSIQENGDGYFLTKDTMAWFIGHYVSSGVDATDPGVSPLNASDEALARVAPAHVVTAEFDPLRDEGEAYAARLERLGVPVTSQRYDGMIHGFFQMGGVTPVAITANEDAAEALRKAFAAV